MKLLSLALLPVAGFQSVQGATSAAFTDPATGISFQAFTSGRGSKFGIALPKSGGKDLIGILSAPKKYTYAGGVLGATMNGTILIVAWPDGNTMMGSLRKVPDGGPRHAAPPEITTNISLSPIPKGTFVGPSGDWQYTFVCTGCLGRTDAHPATADTEDLAWALSDEPLAQPSNRAGLLNHHHAGSGKFSADMVGARHEKYAQWAKMTTPSMRKYK